MYTGIQILDQMDMYLFLKNYFLLKYQSIMHKNHNAMFMINGCMNTYMHKTMVSLVSLEKIEIIRSQEFMVSEARLKFLKKMIILRPKTAILGPQFCRILVLGPHFWWSGGAWAPPGSTPVFHAFTVTTL